MVWYGRFVRMQKREKMRRKWKHAYKHGFLPGTPTE